VASADGGAIEGSAAAGLACEVALAGFTTFVTGDSGGAPTGSVVDEAAGAAETAAGPAGLLWASAGGPTSDDAQRSETKTLRTLTSSRARPRP
jgi:hypothetical protein